MLIDFDSPASNKLSFEEIFSVLERNMAPLFYAEHQAEILTQNSFTVLSRGYYNRVGGVLWGIGRSC